MRLRRPIALILSAAALVAPASAFATHSVGTSAQIAWVRRAATNFVTAELSRNGTGACGILNAPLRATLHRRTCAQRLDARATALLHSSAGRAQLHAQLREIPAAVVIVHGNTAALTLPTPLMGNAANRFLWTENCWMLEG
ncbi:MAG TPA: hypothetical protein VHT29_11645 [Solirubrobacteraceae bacterium]|nr:hypothetical protein [Solirubrobacteraceae bacterium]